MVTQGARSGLAWWAIGNVDPDQFHSRLKHAGRHKKTMTTKITKAEKEAYALIGRKGGKAIARKLGKKGMSSLGKAGAAKRWPKKK